jgi:hypothetical protein
LCLVEIGKKKHAGGRAYRHRGDSSPKPSPISFTSTSFAPTPTIKTSAPGKSSSSSNHAGLFNLDCFHPCSWTTTWTTLGDTMSLGIPTEGSQKAKCRSGAPVRSGLLTFDLRSPAAARPASRPAHIPSPPWPLCSLADPGGRLCRACRRQCGGSRNTCGRPG